VAPSELSHSPGYSADADGSHLAILGYTLALVSGLCLQLPAGYLHGDPLHTPGPALHSPNAMSVLYFMRGWDFQFCKGQIHSIHCKGKGVVAQLGVE
jgi:hypothetical protein